MKELEKGRCVNDFKRNGAEVISDEFLKERKRRPETGKDIEREKDSSVTAWLSFKEIGPQKQAQKWRRKVEKALENVGERQLW